MKRRSIFATLFILVVAFVLHTPVFAEKPNDITNHWAEKQISEWVEKGLIKGYSDGTFRPDNKITRAEFMSIINRAFNFTKTSFQIFKDVSSPDWFASDVSKALTQGYIKGDKDGSIRPNSQITRQEVAVIIAKILKLKPQENTKVEFSDSYLLKDQSIGYVNAVVKEGYINGYDDNTFRPEVHITRAEAVTILSKVIGNLVNATGAMLGQKKDKTIVSGNVTVSKSDIILRNLTILGNLYLTEGIGNGHVALNNIIVKGSTLVSGGGVNSIIIINSTLGQVVINVPDNSKVRLVAEGATSIDKVEAQTESKLEERNINGKGFGEVAIEIPQGAKVELLGDFDRVDLKATDAKVEVLSGEITQVNILAIGADLSIVNGKVEELVIKEEANGTNVNIHSSATVETLVCNQKADISGTGKIENAEINANDVTIAQKPTVIKVANGITAVINNSPVDSSNNTPTITNNENIPTSSNGTSSTGHSSGSGSGGGGSNPPPNYEAKTLTADTTENNIDNDIIITFTDDAIWRATITAVKIGSTTLIAGATNDYEIAEGTITFHPATTTENAALLRTPGNWSITITATGYHDSTVTQAVHHGAVKSIELTQDIVAPTANGRSFATQPIITLKDQYNNICTEDNSTIVTASRADLGPWDLLGTVSQTVTNGIATYTDLRSNNLDQVSNAQIQFSTDVLQVTSSTVTLPEPSLTIMYYGDADNNLEPYMLSDVQEMKDGVTSNVNLIVLFDRIGNSNDATVFGEEFIDTRLYRITPNTATRIGGMDADGDGNIDITTTSTYEANMGDAKTLKNFIDFCKTNYPASKYALILSNHGGGARSPRADLSNSLGNNLNNIINKDICQDDTSGSDSLFTAEITDILDASESVDFLGFDACIMGSVEVAYQYRSGNGGFNAQVMVASAPDEWGNGWKYDEILRRLKPGGSDNGESDTTMGGNEQYYDPADITMTQLGGIIVEEQRDSTALAPDQSLSCYDLTKVTAVKTAVDILAQQLATENKKDAFEGIRGSNDNPCTMCYFNPSFEVYWLWCPYFDLYDLCKNTSSDIVNFSDTARTKADAVMNAVDEMVVYSYAGNKFTGFSEGKNGVSIFFSDGDRPYSSAPAYGLWACQLWYNSTTSALGYGKLSWCIDGQNTTPNAVGNWFEMLDSWFDPTNGENGGVNGFQW